MLLFDLLEERSAVLACLSSPLLTMLPFREPADDRVPHVPRLEAYYRWSTIHFPGRTAYRCDSDATIGGAREYPRFPAAWSAPLGFPLRGSANGTLAFSDRRHEGAMGNRRSGVWDGMATPCSKDVVPVLLAGSPTTPPAVPRISHLSTASFPLLLDLEKRAVRVSEMRQGRRVCAVLGVWRSERENAAHPSGVG